MCATIVHSALRTHMNRLTVPWIGFCLTGPISLCVDSFLWSPYVACRTCQPPAYGWRLAGPASDFVVRDVCCIWNTQDMAEAPLVKSINSSTGTGRHTPRVCSIPFSKSKRRCCLYQTREFTGATINFCRSAIYFDTWSTISQGVIVDAAVD